MSNDLLSQFTNFFRQAITALDSFLKVFGGVAVLFALGGWFFEMLWKKKSDERVEAMSNIKYILIGSFLIGNILLVIGFMVSHFANG